ncbi:hypothetical protein ABPG75_009172 [Micractinium tetrahymenae]
MGWHGANGGGGGGAHAHRPRSRLPSPATLLGTAFLLFMGSQLLTTSPFGDLVEVPRTGPAALTRYAPALGGSTGGRPRRPGIGDGPDIHSYLQPAFTDIDPATFVANISSWYDAAVRQEAAQPSFYAHRIEQDLAPWAKTGITKGMVDGAASLYDDCEGDLLRFQILNGSLWVQHITERRAGWFPAEFGPGNVAAKGRVPYTILALLETLRLFPGQIPDVDAVFHFADFCCVARNRTTLGVSLGNAKAPGPLPILGMQGSAAHLDIAFPDFSYWGTEHGYLEDPWGRPAHGWAAQAEVLRRQYANVSLLDRIPQAVWRGRTQDSTYPERDALRRKVVGCVQDLKKAGRHEDAALLAVSGPHLNMQDSGYYRYNLYIESQAYASNLKQKLATGSLVVAPRLQYHEFFGRDLVPGEHYVAVSTDEGEVCEELVTVLRDMNAMLDSRGRRELSSTGHLPQMPAGMAPLVAAAGIDNSSSGSIFAGRKPAGLFGRKGGSSSRAAAEEPVAGPDGSYSWASGRMPWQIAAAGQRFVLEHVRMPDVFLYMRDLLRAYAALQRFRPAPFKSACYTGDLLLEQFAAPHAWDGQAVAAAYPWLRGYDAGCTEALAALQQRNG